MSQPDFFTILDECVSRVRQGELLEDCLADHPTYSAELASDLTLTAELLHLSQLEPSPRAVENGYQMMMTAFDASKNPSQIAGLTGIIGTLLSAFRRPQPKLATNVLRIAAMAVVLLAVMGTFVLTASADALPGDVLYPVKRSWENARVALTMDDSSRQALRSEYEKRRRDEVQAVQELRRPVVVEFSGVVESIDNEMWQVDGLALTITDDTQVSGLVSIGQRVTVRAQVMNDGTLNALRIVVHSSPIVPGTTRSATRQPTATAQPVQGTNVTRNIGATPSSPSTGQTRPEPTPAVSRPTTDRPTPESTGTPTPSAVDRVPTVDGNSTREPQPTSTKDTDSRLTSMPLATETQTKTSPTATRAPVDVAPTPTATSTSTRDKVATPTATATRNADGRDSNDRPP